MKHGCDRLSCFERSINTFDDLDTHLVLNPTTLEHLRPELGELLVALLLHSLLKHYAGTSVEDRGEAILTINWIL